MKFSTLFTDARNRVLADLYERDREERQAGIREPLSLKAVSPSVAQLLYLLILAKGARIIVEFGTSHGYSTIHLAFTPMQNPTVQAEFKRLTRKK